MAVLEVSAYAKLNLSLDVLDKRPDGYHEMRMVMQTVSLQDRIALETGTGAPLQMRSNLGFLPNDEHNLAAAAALRLCRETGADPGGLAIRLDKQIPVCAGMAGGSSDAAAVLRALNQMEGEPFSILELARIGERVGSDVPYCVLGGTALAEGRGEVLTPLPPLPHCWVVVCKPPFPISTPVLYDHLDRVMVTRLPDTQGVMDALAAEDLEGVARRMYNVFEDVLPDRQRSRVADIKNTLIHCGALGATMSGTGPSAFGLFTQLEKAKSACELLREQYRETFLAETV